MLKKRKVLGALAVIVVVFVTLIVHFMSVLNAEHQASGEPQPVNSYEAKILLQLYDLPKFYRVKPNRYDNITETYLRSLLYREADPKLVWQEMNRSVSGKGLFRIEHSLLGNALHALRSARIVKADLDRRGTQLKLLLSLEGGVTAVFKPQWYSKERVIEGPVYAGKDRHASEILAFHLAALLNKPLTPLSVQRVLHLDAEVIPVATEQLLQTAFKRRNSTCVYGKCFYCRKEDPICADSKGQLAGTAILNLNVNLKSNRSPWQRTYKRNKKALWEVKDDYCKGLKISKGRLFDLVDTAIFDFLIQNGDRHHYETLEDRVVWIDNGKGLGNPNVHHIDILAPLYQCCILKGDTWSRLKELAGGLLSENLKRIPELADMVSNRHFEAIDRRLLIIFATIEYCRSKKTPNHSNRGF